MRSIFVVVLLFGATLMTLAQREVPENLPYFEDKPYQFGFTVGAVFPSLQLMHSGLPTPQGTILVGGVRQYTPGINVAVLASLRLTHWLSLRVSPGVSLTNTTIQFGSLENGVTTLITTPVVTVPATYIEMPIVLKFSGARYANFSPYLIGGINLRDNASPFDGNPVALKAFDWALVFGAGMDVYLPYFRFGVELKTSIGMNDVMRNDRPDLQDFQKGYTRAIDKAFSRMFILSFNFE